jgi:hypothetical protein
VLRVVVEAVSELTNLVLFLLQVAVVALVELHILQVKLHLVEFQ